MTLLERYRANECAVRDCARARHADAAVCDSDLGELWANRLVKQADGTYIRRRAFAARDESGWVRAA